MVYNELKRSESHTYMEQWKRVQDIPSLNDDELKLRTYLVGEYKRIKSLVGNNLYQLDLQFGLALFKCFEKDSEFSMRLASSDGFWRYISLLIIPDIVTDRWGKDKEDRFWTRSSRIWLSQVWWFIYLSLQFDSDKKSYDLGKTEKMLSQKGFSTDEIMNLVERVGKKGTYIEVYREIVRVYASVSDEERKKHKGQKKGRTLFRKIMILHTAKSITVDPYLYGIKEYVSDLFDDLNIQIN